MRNFASLIILVAKVLDNIIYHLYFKRKQTKFEANIKSPDEKLRLMNIEGLKVCYGTSVISNFNFDKAKLVLISNQMIGFEINDVIIKNNSIYIKLKYSIPYNNGKNEYGSCFSISLNENNDNITIFGYETLIANEKEVFYSIAKEIITEISK